MFTTTDEATPRRVAAPRTSFRIAFSRACRIRRLCSRAASPCLPFSSPAGTTPVTAATRAPSLCRIAQISSSCALLTEYWTDTPSMSSPSPPPGSGRSGVIAVALISTISRPAPSACTAAPVNEVSWMPGPVSRGNRLPAPSAGPTGTSAPESTKILMGTPPSGCATPGSRTRRTPPGKRCPSRNRRRCPVRHPPAGSS